MEDLLKSNITNTCTIKIKQNLPVNLKEDLKKLSKAEKFSEEERSNITCWIQRQRLFGCILHFARA